MKWPTTYGFDDPSHGDAWSEGVYHDPNWMAAVKNEFLEALPVFFTPYIVGLLPH